MHGETLKIKR